jgi:putative transposase
VTARSVRRWRRAWEQAGADALRSAGPASVERLSSAQWGRLERELRRGPLAHGFDDEFQGWTLKRVKLLIGRMFHVGYTIQGVWKLLRRHGWSAQVPVRRALERDGEAGAAAGERFQLLLAPPARGRCHSRRPGRAGADGKPAGGCWPPAAVKAEGVRTGLNAVNRPGAAATRRGRGQAAVCKCHGAPLFRYPEGVGSVRRCSASRRRRRAFSC